MELNPINLNNQNNVPMQKHGIKSWLDKYTPSKDNLIVAGTTLCGTAISAALLAKGAGYSLKPSKMFKNITNSYLAKVKYTPLPVIGMGAGSCLGGLAGGYIIDKNPDNRKAKRRETVMQIGNISIPIITVWAANALTKNFSKVASSVASIGAIFVGVNLANFLMNKLSNLIFHNNKEARKVKTTDFSAHLDDFILAASYISDAPLVQRIARLIPIALMIPGNEIGNKKAHS